MSFDDHDHLIDAYFSALDAEDFEQLEPHLATDFRYIHPDTTANDVDGMRRFFDERAPQDTTHEPHRRLHAEDGSIVEGRITGELADGTPREGHFCDVFDFDETAGHLTRVAVYPRG
jgi:ketosteroid isomerase-like protein